MFSDILLITDMFFCVLSTVESYPDDDIKSGRNM